MALDNGWLIQELKGERSYYKLHNGSPYKTDPPGSVEPADRDEAAFQLKLLELAPGYYDDDLKPVPASEAVEDEDDISDLDDLEELLK